MMIADYPAHRVMANVYYLDPFHGGSHAAAALTWRRASRHRLTLWTLPARAWKWRMRGAAVTLAEKLRKSPPPELIVTTDMLSVPDLKALLPSSYAGLPIAFYCHETQLTYPVQDPQERDLHFAFTNVWSALAADAVWFNSAFHRQAFVDAIEPLLHRMPDCQPRGVAARILAASKVLHPCVELGHAPRPKPAVNLVVWNHRWEHDKNPEALLSALHALRRSGMAFKLAVLGQRFRQVPPAFETIQNEFSPELVQFGEVEPQRYKALLDQANIVVSTARHEFFGIATVEAMARGAYPLLPDRLAYPELIPSHLHADHLYGNVEELAEKLVALLQARIEGAPPELVDSLHRRFGRAYSVPAWDRAVDGLVTPS